jgi:hypothetical protein
MFRSSLRLLASTAVLTSLLAGCVVVPEQPYYTGEVVSVAPPPPQVEYIGPPPVAGYIWLGGYWGWHGGRHTWVGGHWAAPRPGYHWVPPAWHQAGPGWRFHPGRWSR